MNKILFLWFPAFVWAGIIFYLSNQSGLKAGLSTPDEIIVRKIAHITEYGVLAWLIWRISRFGLNMKLGTSAVFSVVVAVLYAASDELHQLFVMGRTGKLADVGVDLLGASLAIQVIVPIYIRKFKLWMLAVIAATFVLLVLLVGQMVLKAEQSTRQMNPQVPLTDRNETNPDAGLVRKSEEKEQVVADGAKQDDPVFTDSIEIEPDTSPEKVLLDVPFTSQAPFAVWDDVHEEACEETSLIMVKYFLDGKKLSPETAENEIQKMKDYQLEQTGDYTDSNMEELVGIAKGFYGLDNLKVVYDFSKSDLKEELARGNPVIVPTAGRELGNPFFTPPGPLYHNLVLTGYDGNTIFTNDPGTKHGEKFNYDIDVLFDAIHDFPGSKESIDDGSKAMIVIR